MGRAEAAGVPFAAALVDTRDHTVAAVALNTAAAGDPTAHAELNVIREGAARGLDLSRHLLVSTAESCPMCAAAAVWANVPAIAFGSAASTLDALGIRGFPQGVREVLTGPGLDQIDVTGKVREELCDRLFAQWAAARAPGTAAGTAAGVADAQAASRGVAWRPPGFRSVTPYLAAEDSTAALAFYEAAFGARVIDLVRTADGTVTHAEVLIGDSIVQIHDVLPVMRGRTPRSLGGTSVTLTLYTDDLDGVLQRALAAGAALDSAPRQSYWGDRYARVTDPAGHGWTLATRLRTTSRAEQLHGAEGVVAEAGRHAPRQS
ncbi:VOC family protein [Streptomyces sp. NPDC048507]|uniref:VOC family protein n=1 Tax=Streptomyces sp. NPDC048507 TaxID=3365560 RepID=UPI0037232281